MWCFLFSILEYKIIVKSGIMSKSIKLLNKCLFLSFPFQKYVDKICLSLRCPSSISLFHHIVECPVGNFCACRHIFSHLFALFFLSQFGGYSRCLCAFNEFPLFFSVPFSVHSRTLVRFHAVGNTAHDPGLGLHHPMARSQSAGLCWLAFPFVYHPPFSCSLLPVRASLPSLAQIQPLRCGIPVGRQRLE